MIDVSNDGHVTDIGRLVHQGPDLFDREATFHKFVSMLTDACNRVLKERQYLLGLSKIDSINKHTVFYDDLLDHGVRWVLRKADRCLVP